MDPSKVASNSNVEEERSDSGLLKKKLQTHIYEVK